MKVPQYLLGKLGAASHKPLALALLLMASSLAAVQTASSLGIGKSDCEIEQQRALIASAYELVPDRAAYAAQRICERIAS